MSEASDLTNKRVSTGLVGDLDDVGISGVGDGEAGDGVELTARGTEVHVVASVVVHSGAGKHGVVLDLQVSKREAGEGLAYPSTSGHESYDYPLYRHPNISNITNYASPQREKNRQQRIEGKAAPTSLIPLRIRSILTLVLMKNIK